MYDDQVPENVKEVTKLIADPKRLMNEALKLIDPAWADNMYYVNIFAHNGSTAWHKERVLTWVRDFVTATESEIKFKEGIGDNLERRFVGWKPLKQIPSNDDIVKIVSHVLTECSNRIRFVGHEPKDEVYQGNSIQNAIAYMLQWPGRQPVSMRDFMDVLETVFASMLPSAEYVRKRLWWSLTQHIVAESWRCACMLRDQHSFFNVKTAVAY